MKKKVIATSAVLGLAALILGGGTLAYFTDSKEIPNNFTVGNVEIELIESQLHRANAGVANGATSNSPLWTPGINKAGTQDNTSSVKNGHVVWTGDYFSDQQILDDSANYESNNGYFTISAKDMVPGKSVRKAPYIINKGTVDAYVRTEVLIPKTLFTIIDNGPSMWTTTAMNERKISSKHVDYYLANGYKPSESMTEVIDSVEYYVFDFTYTDALKPGEMTFWNAWGNIAISKDATEKDFANVDSFDVIVRAKAVQESGFKTAEAAFAATFDK